MSVQLLIVDDSPISRKLIRRALPPTRTFEIREAGNGREAVALYQEAAADLVLMDMIMPEMGGVEAIEHIRRGDPQAKVVALTSDVQETTRDRLLAAGARQVLHKPVRAADLAAAIDTWLGAPA